MTKPREESFGWTGGAPTQAHRYLIPRVLSELLREGVASGTVADIGSGNGAATAALSRKGYTVVGLESSDDGVSSARASYPHLTFLQGSLYGPLPSGFPEKVDVVTALEVVEHLVEPQALFRLARDLLPPGGVLVVTTPFHGYLKNLALSLTNRWDRHWQVERVGGHVKFFSRKSLTEMARREGFSVERIGGAGRLPGLWKSMVLVARAPGPMSAPLYE